jgi:membrane associated rhomboid family serine protease
VVLRNVKNKIVVLFSLLAIMLGLQILNDSSAYVLNYYGVLPRRPAFIHHIFFAPFLHGSWPHFINNMMIFSVLSAVCLIRSPRYYLASSFFIIVISGLLVWGFARHASHVGASGWIFGLWSLCIATGWYQKRLLDVLIAVFIVFFYGGMVWGLLPSNPLVSFEYHIAGGIAGVVVAWATARLGLLKRS